MAIITITLKTLAWTITDSVGLLSDAMESFVNLASAIFGLVMVTLAALAGPAAPAWPRRRTRRLRRCLCRRPSRAQSYRHCYRSSRNCSHKSSGSQGKALCLGLSSR